ncbi:MAG TPA: spore coat protein [Bacillaceae bacterium]
MTIEDRQKTLAWHETLEVHELTAFQSIGLMKLKMSYRKVTDAELKTIYQRAIQDLELNLRELMPYYANAPRQEGEEEERNMELGFYAGDLLGLMKTSVRNYGIAITETATPVLRRTLTNHLMRAIQGHERIYQYMYKRGLYPSYDLDKLLRNDLSLAQRALAMKY